MAVESGPGSPAVRFDVEEADGRWERILPAVPREQEMSPEARRPLLSAVRQFLEVRAPDALSEVEREAYRLACALEPRVGRETALRVLREGVRAALAPLLREAGGVDPAEAVLLRVTDAAWQAHADALQETIRRQQQERFQHELTLAKRIQERLLPRSIPEIPGFDIAGRVLPATEVGGDYWSCKSYPEDDIVTLKLADVTGHGVAAATLVAAVKFISGGYYRGSKSAGQVMERTNNVLVRETPSEIMVTMFYGWLYPESGEMTVVNAGHSPVLHYHRGRFCHIPPTGPALGMLETKYREIRLSMDPGDIFVTCSDGVTEPSGEVALGEAWVERQVAAAAHEPAAAIVQRVLDEALRVYGTPLDDMSMVVVKRLAE